ncbi:MAG: N-acetyl-gamma-glutamyl-phosphate reductase [Clostridiales bacterium]
MKYKVFVDGQHGTTGLEIYNRLKKHNKIEFLNIDYSDRRDIEVRKKLINSADIVFLCLPDSAAKESVALIKNPDVRVIDASVAHRINEDWVYGIPELNKNQRLKIHNSNRICVPGCHATGFVTAVAPLISDGIIPKDYPVSFHSITGYSGGGKNMICEYENNSDDSEYKAPRQYSLSINHKHLPEMKKYSGLDNKPIFTPIVSNYYKGMAVSIPLFKRLLNKNYTPKQISDFLCDYYKGEHFITVKPFKENIDMKYFDLTKCNNTNKLDIFVLGNDENILIVTRFDNLGKGASGAAIQNMNIMLGIDETTGL